MLKSNIKRRVQHNGKQITCTGSKQLLVERIMDLDNLFFTAVYRSLNKSEEQFLNNRIEKVYNFENDRTEIISTILDCSVTRVDIRLLTTGIANLSTMEI